MEIEVTVLLVQIIVVDKHGVTIRGIRIRFKLRQGKRIRLDIVAAERTYIVLRQRCGKYQIVRTRARDYIIVHVRLHGSHLFAQVVDEHSRHILSRCAVDIQVGIWITEERCHRVMHQRMRAALQINAVGRTVGYLAIGNRGIGIEANKPVHRHIVNPASVNRQLRQRRSTVLRLTEQAHIATQNIHITERILPRTRAGMEHIEAVPLTGSIGVWHGIKQVVGTVTADGDRLAGSALGRHIAQCKNRCLVVHIQRGARLDSQVLAED